MWIYDFELKNGIRKMFYTDSPFIPDEVSDFCEEHKGEIKYRYCDHFSCSVKSFINGKSLESSVVICNDSDVCDDDE